MPRQGRLNGNLGGFQIAHFANHDDVRVLADDGAQRAGKIEPDGRLGLNLVDALKLVFHRVFNRDDLALGRVEHGQRGIQRGGLSRAGRPGDQNDAVRHFQLALEVVLEVFGKTQAAKIEHDGFAVKNTHDHRFAGRGGHGGHAHDEVLAAHRGHDASVLGQAPLGDVEPRHDLDARNDCGGRARRRGFDLLQNAVDAVAHLEAVFERFDMNVGGARFDRALQNEVDDADDRRFGGQVAQMLDILDIAALAFAAQVFGNLPHGRFATAKVAFDGVVDFGGDAHARQHLAIGGHAQGAQGELVERIGHDHLDAAVVNAHRYNVALFHVAHRNGVNLRRFLGVLALDQHGNIEQLGLRAGQVALRHQAQAHQQGEQVAAVLLAIGLGALQVFLAQALLFYHELAQLGGAIFKMIAHAGQQLGFVGGGQYVGVHGQTLRQRPYRQGSA